MVSAVSCIPKTTLIRWPLLPPPRARLVRQNEPDSVDLYERVKKNTFTPCDLYSSGSIALHGNYSDVSRLVLLPFFYCFFFFSFSSPRLYIIHFDSGDVIASLYLTNVSRRYICTLRALAALFSDIARVRQRTRSEYSERPRDTIRFSAVKRDDPQCRRYDRVSSVPGMYKRRRQYKSRRTRFVRSHCKIQRPR